jgi:hypothetical protein
MEALCAFPRQLARARSRGVTLKRLGIIFLLASSGMAQQGQQNAIAARDPESHASALPVSVKDLIGEAERNNPEIAVAEHGYAAATHGARQASALPDTQVTFHLLRGQVPLPQ